MAGTHSFWPGHTVKLGTVSKKKFQVKLSIGIISNTGSNGTRGHGETKIIKPLPKYSLVTKPEELADAYSELKKALVLGVDTESSNFYTFTSRICLVQMSAFADSDESEPYASFIFDPVGLDNNLTALAPLFTNPEVVKIFHSCEDDIKLLKKDFGFEIANNFDTHLAAKYLSLKEHLSLQSLVKKLYDVQLDKKWQKADWRIRPLDPKQLDYAINDTIFLNGIRNYLLPKLAEKGLSDEFNDHCRQMTGVLFRERFDLDQMWVKFARKSKIPRHARSFLKAFYNHRLRLAKKTDIAGFRLFPEIHLVDLTLDIAEIETEEWTGEAIEDVLLASYGEYNHFIQDLEQLAEDLNWALANPEIDYPNSPETKLTPSESKQLRFIQEYKGKMAERRGFGDPSLIFPKKNAIALLKNVIGDPFGNLTKDEVNGLLGWSDFKHDIYGEELRKLERTLRNKYQARANSS